MLCNPNVEHQGEDTRISMSFESSNRNFPKYWISEEIRDALRREAR